MSPSIENELLTALPHLRAFARSLTGDLDRADDLVQDAVARALAAAHQYTPGTNFKAWVFTILRNLYFNDLRRGKFKAEPLDDAPLDSCAVPPRQEANLEFDDLRRALMQLTAEQRQVVILVGASGFSYEDAARICDCAVGTIRSRLSRARRELIRLMFNETAARGDLAPRHRPQGAEAAVERDAGKDRTRIGGDRAGANTRRAATGQRSRAATKSGTTADRPGYAERRA